MEVSKREVGTGRKNRVWGDLLGAKRGAQTVALRHYRAHHLRDCPLDVESIITPRKWLCGMCANQVFLSGLRPSFSALALLLSDGSQLPGAN